MEDLDFMDSDVVAEVSYVGEQFIFAGNDDPYDPMQQSLSEFNDQDPQEQYFQGYASTETTAWKDETKLICRRVELNGATNHYLATSKDALEPTLAICRLLAGTGPTTGDMQPSDFINIWLNRDFYNLIMDYLSLRIDEKNETPSYDEIFEMIRMWILQFLYRETSRTLFEEPECYGLVQELNISRERYDFLFKKLGADLPQLDVYIREEDDEVKAGIAWGNFHQWNPILLKMEQQHAEVGKHFIFESILDMTFDDDKIHHSSHLFHLLGLSTS